MLANLISLIMTVSVVVGNPNSTIYYEFNELPVSYRELLEEATYDCPYRKWLDVDGGLLKKLIDIERKYNIPEGLRGMLLAAACMESGYDPNAKGDYRGKGKKKSARAVGILQQWPWYENKKKGYGINRRKPLEAADAWMKHIIKQIPKVKKRCGFTNEERIWKAAWVTAIRYHKKGGRCYERANHLKLLQKWQRNIKRIRERKAKDGNE